MKLGYMKRCEIIMEIIILVSMMLFCAGTFLCPNLLKSHVHIIVGPMPIFFTPSKKLKLSDQHVCTHVYTLHRNEERFHY